MIYREIITICCEIRTIITRQRHIGEYLNAIHCGVGRVAQSV